MTTAPEIFPEEVKSLVDRGDEFLLLDVREQDEYEAAHIEGAVLIPMTEIAERVGEIQSWQSRPVVVHCHKGVRSLRVANWLREQHGFQNVKSMAGGIDAWSEEIDGSVPRY